MAAIIALTALIAVGITDAAFSDTVKPADIEMMFTDWGCNYRGLNGIEAATQMHTDINDAIKMSPTFAGFCNGPDADINKQEAAAFFATVRKETGGLSAFEEKNKTPGVYCTETVESGANAELKAAGLKYPCNLSTRGYHGRGAIQLTWNINYGRFSEFLYNDKMVLLNNPDLVVGDGPIGWASTLWFWMSNQDYGGACPPKQLESYLATGNGSCHKAMQSGDGMGLTINIINGGYECCPITGYRLSAIARVQSYFDFLGMLKAQKAHPTCAVGNFGNCEISRQCPVIHERKNNGWPVIGTCTSAIVSMWMPIGPQNITRWTCSTTDPGTGGAPAPAPTTAAPTTAAPAPTTAAPTTAAPAPTTAAPTTAAPAPTTTGSAKVCKSIVGHITDEWCKGVDCASSYSAYCAWV